LRAPFSCRSAFQCTLGGRASHLVDAAPSHLSLLASATAALGRTVEAQAPLVAEMTAHLAPLRAGGGLSKQLSAFALACADVRDVRVIAVLMRPDVRVFAWQLRLRRLARRRRSAPPRRSAPRATRSASCAPQRRVSVPIMSFFCAHHITMDATHGCAHFRFFSLLWFCFRNENETQSELKDAREETRKLRDEFKAFKGASRKARSAKAARRATRCARARPF
jgi:hypothetical protein